MEATAALALMLRVNGRSKCGGDIRCHLSFYCILIAQGLPCMGSLFMHFILNHEYDRNVIL